MEAVLLDALRGLFGQTGVVAGFFGVLYFLERADRKKADARLIEVVTGTLSTVQLAGRILGVSSGGQQH